MHSFSWTQSARRGLSALLIGGSVLGSTFLVAHALGGRLPRVAPWRLAFFGLLAVASVLAWRRRRTAIEGRLFDLGVLLLTGGVAVSASIHAAELSRALFWEALLPYAQLLIAWALLHRGLDGDRARWWIALAALLLAASVILDAEGFWYWSHSARRPGGFLGNRNFAGEYLALAVPLLLVLLDRGRLRALLPLAGAALALTRCRSAWIAALMASALVLLLSRGRRRSVAVAAGLVLAGVLVAGVVPNSLHWSETRPLVGTLSRLLEVDRGSGELRVRQYVTTAQMVAATPWFGVGPAEWQTRMRSRDPKLALNRVPHSDILRVLADGGLVAVFGLTLLYLGLLMAALRVRHTAPELLACTTALILMSAADVVLYRPEALVLVMAMAEIVLAAADRAALSASSRSTAAETPSPAGRLIGASRTPH